MWLSAFFCGIVVVVVIVAIVAVVVVVILDSGGGGGYGFGKLAPKLPDSEWSTDGDWG